MKFSFVITRLFSDNLDDRAANCRVWDLGKRSDSSAETLSRGRRKPRRNRILARRKRPDECASSDHHRRHIPSRIWRVRVFGNKREDWWETDDDFGWSLRIFVSRTWAIQLRREPTRRLSSRLSRRSNLPDEERTPTESPNRFSKRKQRSIDRSLTLKSILLSSLLFRNVLGPKHWRDETNRYLFLWRI